MKNIKEYICETKNKFLVKGHTKTQISEHDEKEIFDYLNSRFWKFPEPNSKYYGIKYIVGKDSKGYYIDTECTKIEPMACERNHTDIVDFEFLFNENVNKFNKYDNKQCPKFRWRNHKGSISIEGLQKLKSFKGLPEEIDTIFISEIYSGNIDLEKRNIKKLRLHNCGEMSLQGNATVNEITWLGWDGKKPSTTFTCKNIHKE